MSDLSQFNKWLIGFLDQEQVDLDEMTPNKKGVQMSISDVIVKIVQASPREQAQIQQQLIKFKRRGGKTSTMLKTYAMAL